MYPYCLALPSVMSVWFHCIWVSLLSAVIKSEELMSWEYKRPLKRSFAFFSHKPCKLPSKSSHPIYNIWKIDNLSSISVNMCLVGGKPKRPQNPLWHRTVDTYWSTLSLFGHWLSKQRSWYHAGSNTQQYLCKIEVVMLSKSQYMWGNGSSFTIWKWSTLFLSVFFQECWNKMCPFQWEGRSKCNNYM